jgi:hypothetical protein
MAKTLNFNNTKKQYLTVTLADEAKTTIMVGTPTKKILNELLSMQDSLESANDASTEDMDQLYNSCATIMSRNKGGKEITKEYLEEIFDFEDIIVFFNAYMEFISEVMGAKN